MESAASSQDTELTELDSGIELAIGAPEVAEGMFALVKRMTVFVYGFGCYLVFGLTLVYVVGFIGDFPVPKTIDTGTNGPIFHGVLINLLLVALFGLQHSLMARTTFKRVWARIIPPAAERSTFVLASSAVLLLIVWLWRPLPQAIWSVHSPIGTIILYAVYMLGWVLAVISTFLINHFDFFGLAQVYAHLRGKTSQPPAFKTPLFYRYVRHPMMTGLLIGLWVTPRMTTGHLLFAGSMTIYILVGIALEERSLLGSFGKVYADYRSRTPTFFPFRQRGCREAKSSAYIPETFRSRLWRVVFNCWPALRGTGMHVVYIAPEMQAIHVDLARSARTLNAFGTIFGGSLYAACDPWFSIILLRQLGAGYIVWDKAATIQFKRPGRGTVSGRFAIDSGEVEEIRRLLQTEHSVDRIYHAELTDCNGTVIASVEKVVYVRKGSRKQQMGNPMLRLANRLLMEL